MKYFAIIEGAEISHLYSEKELKSATEQEAIKEAKKQYGYGTLLGVKNGDTGELVWSVGSFDTDEELKADFDD